MTPEQLVLAHQHLPRATVFRMRVTDDLQDEALSAAWLALFESARRFDPAQGQFVTFALWRIRGSVLDVIKREHKRQRAMARVELDEPEPAERSGARTEVEQILRYLTPRERWLLERKYLDDRTYQQLAEERGLSKTRMCRQLAAALQHAREVA